MQVGSIVELIDDNWDAERFMKLTKRGCRYPVQQTLYTVREVSKTGGLKLEEIKNPPQDFEVGTVEQAFFAWRFKEVFPPIKNIEEWVNANSSLEKIQNRSL